MANISWAEKGCLDILEQLTAVGVIYKQSFLERLELLKPYDAHYACFFKDIY
jgi:hypothetical protein